MAANDAGVKQTTNTVKRSAASTFDRDLAIVTWVITRGATDAGINMHGIDVFH
jgi:hypothetical protein